MAAPQVSEGHVWLTDDHVLAHLRQRLTGADSTWMHPAIPPKKLANVRKLHAAHLPAGEEVLAIYDGTAFGSAKDGFIVTSRRVCWKNVMEPAQFLEWHHIDPDEVWVDEKSITVGRAKLETLYGADDDGLYAWSETLVTLATSARPELAKRYEQEERPREPDPGWGGAEVAVGAAAAAAGGAAWGGMSAPAAAAPPPPQYSNQPETERLQAPPYQWGTSCSNVDVHPSSELILAAGDGTIDIHYAANGQRYLAFPAPDSILCARFSPDGNWLLVAGCDNKTNLYEVRSGQHRGATPPMEDYCDEIVWLGGTSFAAASQSGEVWIVDGGSMQPTKRLLGPDPEYNQLGGIAATTDGSRLFVSTGTRIGAFDVATGKIVWRNDNALINSSRLTVSPDGTLLCAAGYDGVSLFDARTGHPGQQIHFRSARGVSWPEGGGGLLGKLTGPNPDDDMHVSWSPRPRFSPAGHTIAVQDHVGNLNFIEVASQTLYPTPRDIGRAWIEDIAWFGDGNHLLVGTSDNQLAIWCARPMAGGMRCPAIGELPADAYDRYRYE